ncbi:MAG: SirB1 family protein, partial [Bryobacteraceae bacterium]
MQELLELLTERNEEVPLDVAALQLAQIEQPEISIEPFLLVLDSYATELQQRISGNAGGEEFLHLANEYLFDELGFHGDAEDYYNPANSCLNEVLMRRLGIPITLSLVYMEIGKRLGRRVYGIGLPGHFIVRYDDDDFSTYVDPFNSGKLLCKEDCFELAKMITGVDVSGNPVVLQPVSKRYIAVRMLNNLRAIYLQREEFLKASDVLSYLIAADPLSSGEYKQRAICRAKLRLFHEARQDLEHYLELAPGAPDHEEVEDQLKRIKKW